MKIKVLLFLLLTSGLPNSGLAQISLDSGLVAYLNFNGNADDQTGNGHHGVLNGAYYSSDQNGTANSAVYFDGLNDYVEIQDHDDLDPVKGEEFAISIWFMSGSSPPSSTYTGSEIVSKWTSAHVDTPYSYVIRLNRMNSPNYQGAVHSNRFDRYTCSGSSSIPGNEVVSLDTWHHVVYQFEGDSLALYLDCKLVGKVADNSFCDVSSPSSIYLGRRAEFYTNALFPFFGKMDEFRFYDRSLSIDEICELSKYREPCFQSSLNCLGDSTIFESPLLRTGPYPKDSTRWTLWFDQDTMYGQGAEFRLHSDTSGLLRIMTEIFKGSEYVACLDSLPISKHRNILPGIERKMGLCPDSSAVLMASDTTYPFILWNSGDQDGSIVVVKPGIYWVDYGGNSTCLITDSFEILQTERVNIEDSASCRDQIELEIADHFSAVVWDDTVHSQSNKYSISGNYSVQMEDSFGCTFQDSFQFHFLDIPELTLNWDSLHCDALKPYKLKLDFDDAYHIFTWSDASSGQEFNVFKAGTYEVVVQNACGSDSLEFEIELKYRPLLVLGPDLYMCTGDEILIQPIQAEHVSNWYWNTGDTGSSIEVKDAGIYTLRVANVCGERTDSIEITAANPTEISIGPDTQFCKTFSYRLGASDTLISGTYYWSPFGQQTPSITTGAYGKYILSYTNEYGCKSRDTLLITEHCHSYIHVPSSFSPNGDGINDLFGVVANEMESFNILIFNGWGEIIYKSNELEFAWDGKYLGVTVQQDVYYYLISYSYLGVPYHMKGSLTVIW